eukprot:scaffold1.g5506.t1
MEEEQATEQQTARSAPEPGYGRSQLLGFSHRILRFAERTLSGGSRSPRSAPGSAHSPAHSHMSDLEQPFLLDAEESPSGRPASKAGGRSSLASSTAGSFRRRPPSVGGEDEEDERPRPPPKQWPQLRFGSVTTRRISPATYDEEGAEEGSTFGSFKRQDVPCVLATPTVVGFNAPAAEPADEAASAAAAAAQAAAQAQAQLEAAAAAFAGGGMGGLPVGFHHSYDSAGVSKATKPPSIAGAPGSGTRGARRPRTDGGRGRTAVVGMVNAVVALPVMFSFAAIIFKDSFFKPVRGTLVKLVFLSSALHQATFAATSSMPFAVGQVQDVGLIFLSGRPQRDARRLRRPAMASDLVADCRKTGVPAADVTATVLTCLTLSTATVGLAIVATGLLKLASVVQYVPLPVVGGYLAFVGWFMFLSGVGISTGVHLGSPSTWHAAGELLETATLLHLLPAAALCVLLVVLLHRARSPYVLPALLVGVPAAFHLVLLVAGVSLDEARAGDWVTNPEHGDAEWQFWKAWQLFVPAAWPNNVRWELLPRQAGKLAALFFVVAFGSSMDVAAIQAEAPCELNYNRELVTVGTSNLVASLSGFGFTGSYIFSQTLFAMRMGVDSPLMGVIVSAFLLFVFVLPLNLMTWLPNFLFGALIMYIGQDIAKDWLFISYKRVSFVEYCLLVATFVAVGGWLGGGRIVLLGLEAGIAIGILLSAASFAVSYARVTVTAFSVVPSRSGAVRTFDQRAVLEAFASRIVASALSGYLFFGSSVTVADKVCKVAQAALAPQPHLGPAEEAAAVIANGGPLLAPGLSGPVDGGERPGGEGGAPAGLASELSRTKSSAMLAMHDGMAFFLQQQVKAEAEEAGAREARSAEEEAATGPPRGGRLARVAAALEEAPHFLILDFRRVQGLDATAARTFVTLAARLARMGVQLIIAHTPASSPSVKRLLMAQGLVLRKPSPLGAAGAADAAQAESEPAGNHCLWFASMDQALNYCEERFLEIAQRHRLCKPLAQSVTLAQVLQARRVACVGRGLANLELPAGLMGPAALDISAAAEALGRCVRRRGLHAGDALFAIGDPSDDFLIVESGGAVCSADGSAWLVDRAALEELARSAPGVVVLLQTIILRSTCLSFSHALEALERSYQ